MKKIIVIALLMFFIQFLILVGFFVRLNRYIPNHYEASDHAVYSMIALFFTFIIFILSVILVLIEYWMTSNYKEIMLFLAYSNCFLQFYVNSFFQFQLFTRPEKYNVSAIIIILMYFILELFLTFYVVNRLYKSQN